LQIPTGVLPVGAFLIFHFAVNARAIAGVAAYRATVERIARLPALGVVETVAIALPLAVHVGLALALATATQSAFEPPHPSTALRWIQRATGAYLAIYVVFHVWSVRLAPERLRGERAIFDLMAAQLAHPLVMALQSLAVIAAAAHFALGLVALGGPHGFALGPGARRVLNGAALLSFGLLALAGLNALLAFVWPAARWMS